MKQKNIKVPIIICSILLVIISCVHSKYNLITIPTGNDVITRHIDFVTISTVFAGFSFTALGMLLGLSSENLIERIKNTSIVTDKVDRIICSIVFFIISVAISLVFILGLNPSKYIGDANGVIADSILYVLCVGYLTIGIIYFIYSVYELYDLIKHVYGYNKKEVEKKITNTEKQMDITREKLRKKDNCQE